ncbi:hypothetical protein ASPCADRAFT_203913 [Aspergillus carbonarius ITEM 5010]|uniref:Uncharacterized protein n=1 Tax=Aspergillus carbonarius (strain ITEM 5010) TaxID=602072 RepID=A0A1R3RZZ5_ASPC5|nr:hypothetical protein ASPCADRAFT_203913 [Aspergillus carbonarius ITEM 5010]
MDHGSNGRPERDHPIRHPYNNFYTVLRREGFSIFKFHLLLGSMLWDIIRLREQRTPL